MNERTERDDSPSKQASALWRRSGPWALSALLHALLIGVGVALLGDVRPPEPPVPPVTVEFESLAPAPKQSTPHARPDAREEAAARPTPGVEARTAPQRVDQTWLALRDRLLAEERPDETPSPPEAAATAAATSALDERPAPPASARDAALAGLGASDVRDVVFVVDASGSMLTAFPQAIATLKDAIADLHPTQRFQILLFQNTGGRTYLAPPLLGGPDRLVMIDATRAAKRAAFAWLDTVSPRGASNPLGALEAALALRPDAIFLASAGLRGVDAADVDPRRVLRRLDRLNPVVPTTEGGRRRRLVIKTISLLEPDPTGLLQAIAGEHAGEDAHRVIGRNELLGGGD